MINIDVCPPAPAGQYAGGGGDGALLHEDARVRLQPWEAGQRRRYARDV